MRRAIVLIGVILLLVGAIVIAFSLVPFPFVTKESYDVPQSSNIISGAFAVPPGEAQRTACARIAASLSDGDLISIYFIVTSGGYQVVDFLVMTELDYLKWSADESYSALVSESRIYRYNNNITIPQNATWYFVWDNSFSWVTPKGVTTTIAKHWNDVAYRDVTVYHTVFPAEYATYTEYSGIGLAVVGVFVIIWGTISKSARAKVGKDTCMR